MNSRRRHEAQHHSAFGWNGPADIRPRFVDLSAVAGWIFLTDFDGRRTGETRANAGEREFGSVFDAIGVEKEDQSVIAMKMR